MACKTDHEVVASNNKFCILSGASTREYAHQHAKFVSFAAALSTHR